MTNQGSLRIGCLCLGLCLMFLLLCPVPATGTPDRPTLGPAHRGSGPPTVLPGARDAWWDEPPDLNGLAMTSEIISEFRYESETANDFYSSASVTILEAVWWGEYYSGGEPDVSAFNLRFYDDSDGTPGSLIAEYLESSQVDAIYIGQGIGGPIYEYHAPVSVDIGVGSYWFSVQACDHVFPPQWGRLAAGQVTGYESVSRSRFLGFPDWTASSQVFGEPLDASQRFIVTPPLPGACCFADLHCESLGDAHCRGLGGAWQGPESICDPNPCPSIPMACCFPDGHCEQLLQAACDEAGGSSGIGTSCDPNPCPQPTGACCFDGYCAVETEANCLAAGGVYQIWLTRVSNPDPKAHGLRTAVLLVDADAMQACRTGFSRATAARSVSAKRALAVHTGTDSPSPHGPRPRPPARHAA